MRAFAAITVPEEVRILYSRLCKGMRDAAELTITRPDKMHITLAFFDDLKESDVEKVKAALTVLDLKSFDIKCSSLGKFDRRGEASVVFVETKSDHLASFTAAFRKNLRTAGVAYDDKPFKAHLTLARVKDMKDADLFKRMFTGSAYGFKEMAFPVGKVTLFSSDLLSHKEIFSVVFEKPAEVDVAADDDDGLIS